MSLLAELQRRKVFKVGAAYLVVGWLLIQIASTVAPQLNLPDWSPRLITFIVLLGFPIAILLAWAVDISADGIKIESAPFGNKRVVAVVAILAALAIGWYWKGQHSASVGGVDARSIAVLPFVNMSGDKENEYFSDGISEEILNVLARVPELSVAARTSSFQYKGEKRNVAQIARELRVRMVLEGSVRRQADRVRITAQLIDASTGYHVWSRTFDRELKDVFAIQDEIARAIGDELKVRVLGEGAAAGLVSGTKNLAAHDLYLRGLSLWQVREQDELFAAIALFEKAVQADPKFAQAWGGIGLAYAVLPAYTARVSYEQAYARAIDAAERALALDPMLPEAYATLGNVESQRGRRETGVALLERAIALRPSFATAHQWLGTTLMEFGQPERSLAEMARAHALDPRSLIVSSNLASMLAIAGRDEEAIAACMPTLEYAPHSILCVSGIGLSYLLLGDRAKARGYYDRWAAERGHGTEQMVAEYFEVLEGRGDREALIARMLAGQGRSWLDPSSGVLFGDFDTPINLMLLGEKTLALDYIDRVSRERAVDLGWAVLMPIMDPIRCDSRFVAAVERMKLRDARAAKLCRAPTPARTSGSAQ